MPSFPTPYKRKCLEDYYKLYNLTDEEIREVDKSYDDTFLFMRICGLTLLAVGVPANLLVLYVLLGRSMRHNLTALFLSYLAVFNLFNLVGGITRYVVVSFRGPDIRLHSETMCMLHYNLLVFGHLGTNWTVLFVGMCKMAYIVVPDTLMKNLPKSFPHVIMITVCTYGYSIIFLFGGVDVMPDYELRHGLVKCEPHYLTYSAFIQMGVTFIFPEVAMVVVNVYTLWMYSLLWAKASVVDRKAVRVNFILGILLFATDIQVVLFEIPYIILNTFKPVMYGSKPKDAAQYLWECYLCVVCLYSSYSLNCLTYCFFAGHFRRELRRILRPTLGVCCDPESRWVSSEASLIVETMNADTVTRLSLAGIFDTELRYSESNEDLEYMEYFEPREVSSEMAGLMVVPPLGVNSSSNISLARTPEPRMERTS